jgi:hypothetical protein
MRYGLPEWSRLAKSNSKVAEVVALKTHGKPPACLTDWNAVLPMSRRTGSTGVRTPRRTPRLSVKLGPHALLEELREDSFETRSESAHVSRKAGGV